MIASASVPRLVVMHCLESDNVAPRDWLLIWRARNDGYEQRRHLVHEVISNIVTNDGNYTKLIGEVDKLEMPPEPFKIDENVDSVIHQALNSGDFPELLSLDDNDWSMTDADAAVPAFLQYIKQQYTSKL